jgi:acetate kinase
MDIVLVVNAGSSSVKFQLYEARDRHDLKRLVKGQIDGVGSRPRLRAEGSDGGTLVERSFAAEEVADLPAAIRTLGTRQAQKIEPFAVGHRVVHGGPDYTGPVLIDDGVLAKLEGYVPLAPLHQPNNLAPIRAIQAGFPHLPQVAFRHRVSPRPRRGR